ncbi:hypothetical protein RB2083_428 [Rhodobacteraceae bacterium HTCC2083]|nr:hypothetical protein RB2083_428 [Rhodobacteraceae bacterium HTCC2083]
MLRCGMAKEPETFVKLTTLQVQQISEIYCDLSHSKNVF